MRIGCQWSYKNDRTPESDYIVLPWFYDWNEPQEHIKKAQKLKQNGATLMGHPLTHKDCSPRRLTVEQIPGYLDAKITGFEDIVDHWDVAVESLNFWDNLPDWHFVAFEHMRKRCPQAKLFMNEYAIQNPAHWERVLILGQRLKDAGLLDGIGFQIHTEMRRLFKSRGINRPIDFAQAQLRGAMTVRRINKYISAIQDMGLAAHISEVSITGHGVSEDAISSLFRRTVKAAETAEADTLVIWDKDLWQYQPHLEMRLLKKSTLK